jgi:hypothetical protein
VKPIDTTARPTVILATLAAIAIVLAVFATAATVIVASDVTREREQLQQRGAVATIPLAEARASLAVSASLRGVVDSLVAPLGPFEAADSQTVALMVHQWDSSQPLHAVFMRPAAAQRPTDPPRTTSDQIAALLRAARGDSALDAATLALAVADTGSSWLGVWRRFARSAPLPAMWGYRDGLPGVESTFDLPLRRFRGARQLMQLNELAGRLALRAGDHASATQRGLENVAASRHYLDSPIIVDFLVGRSIALDGARLVADAARAAGDTRQLARAEELERLATNNASSLLALQRAAERDAASPSGTLAMELFDDDKLPFAVRVEILYANVLGGCGHTREVLFGFSPERESRLAALAAKHRDHPAFGPMLELIPRAARRVREAPTSLLSPDVWPSAGVLDVLLPESVAARTVLCQQSM